MVTRQQLEGKWNEVSGRIKEKWGVMTDDDLSRAEGSVERLVGVIQQKTGQAREEVERFLDSIVAGSRPAMERIASTAKDYAASARDYAAEAQDTMRRQYENVEQSISAGYQEAEECVRRRPVESVAIAFGAGLLSGVLVAALLRDRR